MTGSGPAPIAIIWGEKGIQLLTARAAAMPYEYLGVYTGTRHVWQPHRRILAIDKRDLPGLVEIPGSEDAFDEIKEFRRQQEQARRKMAKAAAAITQEDHHATN